MENKQLTKDKNSHHRHASIREHTHQNNEQQLMVTKTQQNNTTRNLLVSR